MSDSDEPQEPDLEPIADAPGDGDLEPIVDAEPVVAAAADDDSEPEPPRRGRNAILAGVAVGLIAGAALFGVYTANADKANPTLAATTETTPGGSTQIPGARTRRPGTAGTINAIDGSTLTIKAADGTTTPVKTTSATKVTKTDTGTLSAIKVGDNITVIGTGTNTKIAAQRVTDTGDVAATGGPGFGRTPPDGATPPANGRTPPDGGGTGSGTNTFVASTGAVKSISGSTITLTTTSGSSVTVTTSTSTAVSITSSSTVSALAVGDQVVVIGTTTDGVVTATTISEGVMGGFFRGPGNGGPGQGAGGSPPDTNTSENQTT